MDAVCRPRGWAGLRTLTLEVVRTMVNILPSALHQDPTMVHGLGSYCSSTACSSSCRLPHGMCCSVIHSRLGRVVAGQQTNYNQACTATHALQQHLPGAPTDFATTRSCHNRMGSHCITLARSYHCSDQLMAHGCAQMCSHCGTQGATAGRTRH